MINYTLMSRGRVLGHSTLAFAHSMDKLRTGWFYPTDVGTSLMPIITGTRDAGLAMLVLFKRGELPDIDDEQFIKTTEYADCAAAEAHEEALQLELRGPDGRVIRAEDIFVRDTETFIPEIHGGKYDDDDEIELDEESQACVDELVAHFESLPEEPWNPPEEMGRYQLFVVLENEWDIP